MGYCSILTAPEAAKKLGVSNFTVYQLIKDGTLKATDISNGKKYKRHKIREDELDIVKSGYKSHGLRNAESYGKKPTTKVQKPKAVYKSPVVKNHDAKKELAALKEELFNILVKIEEIETKL